MGPVASVEGWGPVANVEGWVLLLMITICVTEIQLCKCSSQFPGRFEPII